MEHTRLEVYGAASLTALALVVSATAITKTLLPKEQHVLIPTLEQELMLYGQVQSDSVPIHEHSATDAEDGITLVPGEHNFITGCSSVGDSVMGDQTYSDQHRYWVYEFTGQEPPFNGPFFVSNAQLADNPNLSTLPSFTTMQPNTRYYVMTESPARFSCAAGITAERMVSVQQLPLSATQLTIDAEPALVAQFLFETDRDMEIDQLNFTQGYWDGNTIIPAAVIKEFTVQTDGVPHQPLNVSTDTFGNIEIDTGSAGERIFLPANTPVTVSIYAETFDPSYDSLGIYLKEDLGLDIRGVHNPADRPNDANSKITRIETQQITLDFTIPVICGDGIVDGDEECDGAANCTSECKAEKGYECANNVCTPLIPSLSSQRSSQVSTSAPASSTVSSTVSVTCSTTLGDVTDPRGIVTIADVRQVFFVVDSGQNPYDEEWNACADMNGDGNITTLDVSLIQGILTGNTNAQGDGESNTAVAQCSTGIRGDVSDPRNSLTPFDLNTVWNIAQMPTSQERLSVFNQQPNLEFACADVNGDGDITLEDVSIIQQDLTSATTDHQGSLTVSRSSKPIQSQQLLGGTLSDPILAFSLSANDVDADVTSLHFKATNDVASVDRLEISLAGTRQVLAYATATDCVAGSTQKDFCAILDPNALSVSDGNTVDVLVRARMKNDSTGAVSGESVEIALKNISTSYATVSFTQDIVGPNNTTVLAKISSITNASPDADGTNVPGSKSSIAEFRLAAADNINRANGVNDVTLDTIVFSVEASNVAMDANAFQFYNKQDETDYVKCLPFYTTGSPFSALNISGTFYVQCNLSYMQPSINAGNTEIFVLEGSVVNPKINRWANASLQAHLDTFSDPTQRYGVVGNHLQWSDHDQIDGTTFDWLDYPDTRVSFTLYQS